MSDCLDIQCGMNGQAAGTTYDVSTVFKAALEGDHSRTSFVRREMILVFVGFCGYAKSNVLLRSSGMDWSDFVDQMNCVLPLASKLNRVVKIVGKTCIFVNADRSASDLERRLTEVIGLRSNFEPSSQLCGATCVDCLLHPFEILSLL